jgi:alanyl-tRNA synthetase
MKPMSGDEIRRTWISFFESKGHKWLPGVNLIPAKDKSLLWVNAGVTGLKQYFDGSEVPPCRRIVNVQKSIRTNDIENVGHTARHQTFFEMLGNFSIGDYFRPEVIAWAYEILTDPVHGFGIPTEKLYVTYNPSDLESLELWQKAGIAKDHLIPLADNYWQIGEGPCGPNTEVFFDRGEKWDPKHLGVKLLAEDIENDRYIEIWGIVFSQFNAVNGVPREKYKELPSKNIDTGAGLERIACILQGTPTNFETDLFMPIIHAVEKLSGQKYEEPNLMAFRVIADHARCLTFALSDGATFSNEGRGYVLRRIIRRAMRYGQKIGLKDPFMYKLVKVVADNYRTFYPELESKVEEVSKMILSEEEKFIKTLTQGEDLLHSLLEGKKELSGEEVFKLYDTFGFPNDLTKEIAAESGVTCDMKGFDKLMKVQRERARSARGEIESFHKQSKDVMAFKAPSEFLYGIYEAEAKVTGLFVDGAAVASISEKGEAAFDKTPFYAEMGGQVSDTGTVSAPDFEAEVTAVTVGTNGQHLHALEVKFGSLKIGDSVTLTLDSKKRILIERSHSATHLLHKALSDVLKAHIDQKGSFVNENYLRFDFAMDRKLSEDELAAISDEVNEKIAEAIAQKTEILPLEEAKKTVRVVEFGGYSREFCGGTHVRNTSDIGLFLIESEDAVAAGVRRIQARTSLGAYEYLENRFRLLNETERDLGASDVDFRHHISSLAASNASLGKDLEAAKARLAGIEAKEIASTIEAIGSIAFVAIAKKGSSREDLLALGDSLKANHPDCVLILTGGTEGAHPLVAFVGGGALKKIKAGDIVKTFAQKCGGSGGGRPEMASGQLKSLAAFDDAAAVIRGSLK